MIAVLEWAKTVRALDRSATAIGFYTISSQMAVRLSALRAGRALPPRRTFWYPFLLEDQ
jgi:hypothetical protein